MLVCLGWCAAIAFVIVAAGWCMLSSMRPTQQQHDDYMKEAFKCRSYKKPEWAKRAEEECLSQMATIALLEEELAEARAREEEADW
jgi:hypothetical protein